MNNIPTGCAVSSSSLKLFTLGDWPLMQSPADVYSFKGFVISAATEEMRNNCGGGCPRLCALLSKLPVRPFESCRSISSRGKGNFDCGAR
jgi:hypothetical protein